jgi:hypothetical protein
MTGWIAINGGPRQSRQLFACGVCASWWQGAPTDWPNFCPFCRGTHIHKCDRVPVHAEGKRTP